MTDDKKKHQDGADDQAQQAQPAGDRQQAPGGRVVAEATIKAYLPGSENSAQDVISAVTDQDIEAIGGLAEFVSRIEINKLIANLYSELHDIIDELKTLEPYLATEFQKKEYAGKTFAELAEKNEDGITLFTKAIQAARAARNADIETAPKITATKTKTVEYPLDKPNTYIWDLLQVDKHGQIEFNLAKYGSKEIVPAYYSINFDGLSDELKITKKLQPFDKRVYIAVSALFNAGNNVITLSQIHYAMGGITRPGGNILSKINDAITKMTTARIFFDNEREAEKYKYNHFKYDGSLLPLERGTAIINGKLANAAIHIFREPPLITFAKQRNQITTIDIKLLQSPVNKTDDNLRIDDYLIERISRAKNGTGRSCRILYKTLYEHAGIADKPKTDTERQQKKRAPEKIKKYLDHYQKTGFISRYTVEKDGLTIHW